MDPRLKPYLCSCLSVLGGNVECSWGYAVNGGGVGSTAMQLPNALRVLSNNRCHHARWGPSATASLIVAQPPLRLITPAVVKSRKRNVAAVTRSCHPTCL